MDEYDRQSQEFAELKKKAYDAIASILKDLKESNDPGAGKIIPEFSTLLKELEELL